MKDNNQRKFSGLFINRKVYLSKEYSWTEKILILEIDSLDSTERGCFASNSHFSEILGKSEGTIANIISKLKKRGTIKVVESSKGGRGLKICPSFFCDLHKNVKDVHENVKSSSRKREHISKEIIKVNLTQKKEEENEDFLDVEWVDVINPPLKEKEEPKKKKVPRKKEKDSIDIMDESIDKVTIFLRDNPAMIQKIKESTKVKTNEAIKDLLFKMCCYYAFEQPYVADQFIQRPDKGYGKLLYWATNEKFAKSRKEIGNQRFTKATGAKISEERRIIMERASEIWKEKGISSKWDKLLK